jgi:hypothetical protein
MSARWLLSLAILALFGGCAAVPEISTYRYQFERLKTREEKAAFAFDLMARRVIAAPASIDTVYSIFGRDMSHEETKNGVVVVDILLGDHSDSQVPVQLPEPWVLRLELGIDHRYVRSCALLAPGEGK